MTPPELSATVPVTVMVAPDWATSGVWDASRNRKQAALAMSLARPYVRKRRMGVSFRRPSRRRKGQTPGMRLPDLQLNVGCLQWRDRVGFSPTSPRHPAVSVVADKYSDKA